MKLSFMAALLAAYTVASDSTLVINSITATDGLEIMVDETTCGVAWKTTVTSKDTSEEDDKSTMTYTTDFT